MCRTNRSQKICYRYDKNIIGDGCYWLRLLYAFRLTIGFLVLSKSPSVIFPFLKKNWKKSEYRRRNEHI